MPEYVRPTKRPGRVIHPVDEANAGYTVCGQVIGAEWVAADVLDARICEECELEFGRRRHRPPKKRTPAEDRPPRKKVTHRRELVRREPTLPPHLMRRLLAARKASGAR